MTKWLKQSTAVDVKIGPFIDDTDGKTAETALTTAYTSVYVFKNGSTSVNKNETTAIAHDVIGFYLVKLNATDTNTLGILKIATHVAGHLSVWEDFMVVPANVYDSLVGGTDALDVSAVQFAGQTITASGGVTIPAATLASTTNITAAAGCAVSSIGANVITAASIAADAITDAKVASDVTIASVTGAVGSVTGAVGSVTGAVGSVTGNVGGNVTGSVGSVAANGITATSIATDAINANSVKADAVTKIQNGLATPTNITAGTITTTTNLTNLPAAAALEATLTAMKGATFSGATDSLEAIRDRGDAAWATATGFSTLDAAGIRTAVGLASANLDTQLTAIDDLIDTEVGAIKTKTDYLPSATAGAAGGLFIAGANAATSITGALTANITGSMSGNVEGNVNGSVGSVVGNVGGNVTGSVGSVVGFTPSNIADIISTLGSPNGASVSVDIAAVKNDTALMKGATFDTATDSLEAIRDRGDAAWDTATGFSTLDAAGVRAAVGLASANLDTQLTAIDDAVDTEVAAIYTRLGAPAGASIAADIAGISAGGGLDAAGVRAAIGLASANLDTQLGAIDDYLDTEVAAIKAKTDLIPAAPASTTNITAASGITVSAIGANVITATSIASNAITSAKIATDAIGAAQIAANAIGASELAADAIAEIADGVWDEDASTHVAALSTGLILATTSDAGYAALTAKLGTPAGASVSADIAAVKAETATIQAKTTNLPAAPASTTNITAGTITTVTNLTNAPTNGDLTATMKTSVTTAATAATPTAAAVTGAVGSVTGAVGSVTGNVGGNVVGSVASVVGAVGSLTTNNDKTGYALTSAERNAVSDALLDRADAIATGITTRQALEIAIAVLAGKLSGAATATITIRDVADTKNVVVATTDASGNRTAVTITP